MATQKEIYEKLINYVNKQLESNNHNKLYFDQSETIDKSLFEFPVSDLLSIKDEEQFVNECFLKILDRYIDNGNLHLISKLKKKQLSKKDIINILYSSKERKVKHLDLNFDGDKI
ncbi:hypothetical protein [Hydrogenimonas thermophila]|uniref:Uncharacterized protein n=1 Tax=Hydrogenimonas thermophila TaxID=223786 RepID=A0A1I5KSB8_9BACT|nr:hypothetical protein [Hydrogenimonas thermophila]SFO87915.1 hypothetical protein SAMN05216234_10164 [Hydrogenimonas thermophila]